MPMISGLLTSLTTSCPQYVRHMDYLGEMIAMRQRSRRNRASWQSHLENTRRFVLSVAEKCNNRNKVVILGAGLLLDVPLKELSSLFRKVALLDIVFLPEVRGKVKDYDNVTLIQHDAANIARKLHANIHSSLPELPVSTPLITDAYEEVGLVVSLNLLSQIWVIPRQYALKKLPCLDEEQVDDWCRQIVESHLAFLGSMPCPVCVVADYEFVKRDEEGEIVSRGSTVYGVQLQPPDASWTWNIIPLGEDNRYLSKELIVGAWYLREQPAAQ